MLAAAAMLVSGCGSTTTVQKQPPTENPDGSLNVAIKVLKHGKQVIAPPAHQRREADVNIEFQADSKQAEGAQKLAWAFHAANNKYASRYPATVGPHMTHTDSAPFMDLAPAISLRENERGQQIGAGWNPHWHQPTDLFATYDDDDFMLGLNAAQTTLAAVARLAGAQVAK